MIFGFLRCAIGLMALVVWFWVFWDLDYLIFVGCYRRWIVWLWLGFGFLGVLFDFGFVAVIGSVLVGDVGFCFWLVVMCLAWLLRVFGVVASGVGLVCYVCVGLLWGFTLCLLLIEYFGFG